jgi:ribosomal protein S18 acetylase RimI-like enzyme
VILRRGTHADVGFLGLMMREAGFPPARRPPLDEALRAPHVAQWLDGWGRDGDLAIIAATDDGTPLGAGIPLGAAWCRRFGTEGFPNYGFVDLATPILAIAVDEAHRGRGIGAALLAALADAARDAGAPALSLSVGGSNRALRLYERIGFVHVADAPNGQLVMRLPL